MEKLDISRDDPIPTMSPAVKLANSPVFQSAISPISRSAQRSSLSPFSQRYRSRQILESTTKKNTFPEPFTEPSKKCYQSQARQPLSLTYCSKAKSMCLFATEKFYMRVNMPTKKVVFTSVRKFSEKSSDSCLGSSLTHRQRKTSSPPHRPGGGPPSLRRDEAAGSEVRNCGRKR
eukprot:21742_1